MTLLILFIFIIIFIKKKMIFISWILSAKRKNNKIMANKVHTIKKSTIDAIVNVRYILKEKGSMNETDIVTVVEALYQIMESAESAEFISVSPEDFLSYVRGLRRTIRSTAS